MGSAAKDLLAATGHREEQPTDKTKAEEQLEEFDADKSGALGKNEFEKALKSALNSNIATIIDVPINPEEDVFPFVVPNTALKDMVIA